MWYFADIGLFHSEPLQSLLLFSWRHSASSWFQRNTKILSSGSRAQSLCFQPIDALALGDLGEPHTQVLRGWKEEAKATYSSPHCSSVSKSMAFWKHNHWCRLEILPLRISRFPWAAGTSRTQSRHVVIVACNQCCVTACRSFPPPLCEGEGSCRCSQGLSSTDASLE